MYRLLGGGGELYVNNQLHEFFSGNHNNGAVLQAHTESVKKEIRGVHDRLNGDSPNTSLEALHAKVKELTAIVMKLKS